MIRYYKIPLLFLCLFSISCSMGSRRNTPPAQTKFVPSIARGTPGMRKRVVVLPFLDHKSSRSMRTADNARRAFVSRLVSSNRFVVVSASDLGKDVNKYRKGDQYDLQAISKIAASSDIAAVVEGSILDLKATKVGDEVGLFRKVTARVTASIRLRIVSTKNQKEVFSDVREATVETTARVTGKYSHSSKGLDENPGLVQAAIRKAFSGSMSGIVRSMDKMEWEGRIAMIRGDRIYVNAGRLTGIQVGDILRVSSEGEEVYDPETGVFIGKAPGRAKGTVEVVSYFGKDGAVAIIHSGGGFAQNDKVDLY